VRATRSSIPNSDGGAISLSTSVSVGGPLVFPGSTAAEFLHKANEPMHESKMRAEIARRQNKASRIATGTGNGGSGTD
jgi:ATP-dependent exoDNAse (exonuclease V) alpha subunit